MGAGLPRIIKASKGKNNKRLSLEESAIGTNAEIPSFNLFFFFLFFFPCARSVELGRTA